MIALALVPLAVLIIALYFGYFLPQRKKKNARRQVPVALAPFSRAEPASLPPRPGRPTPRYVSPSVANAQNSAAAGGVPVAGGLGDVAPAASAAAPMPPMQQPVQARALDADQMQGEDAGRVLRLQVAGDRRDVIAHDHRHVGATTLRLERAIDGTLQFLPGRLEIIEGREVGQELKFVRTPGPDGTSVTFGRSAGSPYRHVQLHEATVSRLHAKMALDGKTWSLFNLSGTNPVVLNGTPLAGEGTSAVLREGDRIEMGEVVFRFRAK